MATILAALVLILATVAILAALGVNVSVTFGGPGTASDTLATLAATLIILAGVLVTVLVTYRWEGTDTSFEASGIRPEDAVELGKAAIRHEPRPLRPGRQHDAGFWIAAIFGLATLGVSLLLVIGFLTGKPAPGTGYVIAWGALLGGTVCVAGGRNYFSKK